MEKILEKRENERLRFALAAAGIGTWDLDPIHNRVIWDERCRELFNFAPGEAVSYEEVLKYMHPEDSLTVHKAVQEALNPESKGNYEVRYRVVNPVDGKQLWILSKGKAYFNDEGVAWRFAGTAQDITASVLDNEKVIASERIAQLALENSNSGYFHLSLIENKLEYSSGYAKILTGKEEMNLEVMDFIQNIHPEDIHLRNIAHEEAAITGKLQYEARTIWNDGSIHWMRANGTYLYDVSGQPYLLTGTIYDTTSEHHQAETLKQTEELLSAAFDNSSVGMAFTDLNGKCLKTNRAFVQILGYSAKEVLDASYFDFIYQDDFKKNKEYFTEVIKGKRQYYNLTKRYIHKNGSFKWVQTNVTKIIGNLNKAGRILIIARDISNDIEKEVALANSQSMFHNVTNIAPTGLWLSDEGGNLTYLNKTLVEWTGMAYEELLGTGWANAIIENDRQQSVEAFMGALSTNSHYDVKFRIKKGNGEIVWCRAAGDPFYSEDGIYAGYAGFCMDIDELERSREELQFAIEATELGIWDINPQTSLIKVNDRLREWFGLSTNDGIPLCNALEIVAEKDRVHVNETLENVLQYTSGGFYDLEYSILNPINNVERIVRAKGRAWFNQDKIAYRFNGTMQDITEQAEYRRSIEASEARFRMLIEEAPIATCLFVGRELRIEIANDIMIGYWGKDKSVVGKPLIEAVPELIGQPFLEILNDVFISGKTFEAKAIPAKLILNGILGTCYFDYTYKPLFNSKGEVYSIMEMAADVTTQVVARNRLEESELFSRNIIQQSEAAQIVWIGEDMVFEMANQKMLEILGRDNSIIGLPFMEAIPELKNTPLMERLSQVFNSGETYYQPEEMFMLKRHGVPYIGYYNYSYQALRNALGKTYGIICTAIEVTEQVKMRKRLEESELYARNIFYNSPVAKMVFTGPDMVISTINQNMFDILGRDSYIIDKPFMESMPELITTPLMERLRYVYATGETYQQPEEKISFFRYGQPHTGYYTYIYKALYNTDNKIYGIMCTCSEVTEQVLSRQRIEEADAQIRNTAERLQVALEAGKLGSYELTLNTGQISCTPQCKKNFGLEDHEQMTYEGLLSMIHEEDKDRVKEALIKAIESKSSYNSEYRIHLSNGSLRWIKASGKLIQADTGEIIKVIGVTLDITEEKNFSNELSRLVNERTIALQRSNEDLMNFAHVASHDLKEPIRKVKTFVNLLKVEGVDFLPTQTKEYIEKIQTATNRMQEMVDGVLAYSELNSPDQKVDKIDLNDIINAIELDLELIIFTKKAIIHKEELPEIEGAKFLIHQLFYNLINNSLKFSKVNEPIEIFITSTIVHDNDNVVAIICVSDNGIGFDEKFSERIFTTFSRLHSKDEYEGAGLGLAICKKIVQRHHGTITASSKINQGAILTISLPLHQKNTI